MSDPILELDRVTQRFELGRGRRRSFVHAVTDVSLHVGPGEIVGLVGESGCGKSSLARMVVQLDRPSSGRVLVDGQDVGAADATRRRELRRRVQMIFQDPLSSLDPRMRIVDIVAEGWTVHRDIAPPPAQRRARAAELLTQVGLGDDVYDRRPRELSGGQRQRVGIARALAVEPSLIVCDEPVSALDVSVQAQVLNLLRRLRDDQRMSFLFIAHDLGVVAHLCDRIAVMHLGEIVEEGPVSTVVESPRHPYTRALLSAVPNVIGRPAAPIERIVLDGDVPSPIDPPAGCTFSGRCWKAGDRCRSERPELEVVRDGHSTHRVACHHPHEVSPSPAE